MCDLFCGKGGWTDAFLAKGWRVRGYDLVQHREYKGEFVYKNLLHLRVEEIADADFICASSPCEEFSVHGMKCFHPNPKPPKIGLKLFNHTREICEQSDIPFIMENVRAAQQFVGQAVNCCGPFALWGPGVPLLLPQGIKKGFNSGGSVAKPGVPRSIIREYRKKHDQHMIHGSRQAAAIVAVIAPELAAAVVSYAIYLYAKKSLDNSNGRGILVSEDKHGDIDRHSSQDTETETTFR
jgi:hypothetical protein